MIYNYNGDSTKGGIYQIRNTINNRFYIGSAKCFKNRWSAHGYSLRAGKHHSKFLQSDYNKLISIHGNDDFLIFEIVEIVEGDKVLREKIEQTHLDEAFSKNKNLCYNMHKTANVNLGLSGPDNGFYGKTHSDTVKEKLSELAKKKTGDKNPNYNNHWNEQMKENMRNKVAERMKDPAYRSKLSESQKNRCIAVEEKNVANQKKREAMLKLYADEDFKKKMVEANKKGLRACKAVNQFTKDGEFLATFPSISAAAKAVGIKPAGITECCVGTQKTAAGYKWSYSFTEG